MNDDNKREERNRALCELIKQNNLKAENEILMENEGLINQIEKAIDYDLNIEENHFGGIEKDDILQDGRLALLRAATEYDAQKGIMFSTYAYTVVRNAMLNLCKKGLSSFEKHLMDDGIVQVFLEPRERRILMYRYGFEALTCKTIAETAAFFHLTENYMKQIEETALKKLRAGMNDGKIV